MLTRIKAIAGGGGGKPLAPLRREPKESRRLDAPSEASSMQVLDGLAAGFLTQGDDEIVARSGLARAAAIMRTPFDTKARRAS